MLIVTPAMNIYYNMTLKAYYIKSSRFYPQNEYENTFLHLISNNCIKWQSAVGKTSRRDRSQSTMDIGISYLYMSGSADQQEIDVKTLKDIFEI